MTRDQLNKAYEIDQQIIALERRRMELSSWIKNSFLSTRPDPLIEDEDDFELLKERIYREIDTTFNAKLRALEEQIAKI